MSLTSDGKNALSLTKTAIICACAGVSAGLAAAISSNSPVGYGLGLWVGFLVGYWMPPAERQMAFKTYAILCALLSIIGGIALAFIFPTS